MSGKFNPLVDHVPEETLDLYVVGRLDEPDLAPVEEHLLICAECQDRTRDLDTLVAALRAPAPGGIQSPER
jgi:anti-sigma factor RsiW